MTTSLDKNDELLFNMPHSSFFVIYLQIHCIHVYMLCIYMLNMFVMASATHR